jgi:hypothetical protein
MLLDQLLQGTATDSQHGGGFVHFEDGDVDRAALLNGRPLGPDWGHARLRQIRTMLGLPSGCSRRAHLCRLGLGIVLARCACVSGQDIHLCARHAQTEKPCPPRPRAARMRVFRGSGAMIGGQAPDFHRSLFRCIPVGQGPRPEHSGTARVARGAERACSCSALVVTHPSPWAASDSGASVPRPSSAVHQSACPRRLRVRPCVTHSGVPASSHQSNRWSFRGNPKR